MTSKKLKKHLTDSKSFDSNSDSDEIEEFTTKFMSHMKKISVEKIMNLNKVDSDSEMTTDDDDDSECDDSDIVSNSLTSCDRDLTSYGRFIESQKLADDEEEEDDDDDDDEGDSVSSHDESESGISSDEESKNEIHQEAAADNSKDEEDSISDTGGTSSDDSSQKSKHRKHLVPNEESNTEEDSGRTTEKDPFKQLQKELADMPFTELQKLKEKIGIKAYNQAVFGSSTGRSGKKVFKRENKNRPTEMSSKRPVPRHREVIQVKKRVYRDPRFDDLSGEYNEKIFKQAYTFISDVKQREKKKLLKMHEKEKDTEKRKQIELLIKRMNQQEKAEREKHAKELKETKMREKELELVRQGKRPYFLKKGDRKKIELAEKFRELKKSGKVEKYLVKRRKKMAAKDRKHLPNKHYVQT